MLISLLLGENSSTTSPWPCPDSSASFPGCWWHRSSLSHDRSKRVACWSGHTYLGRVYQCQLCCLLRFPSRRPSAFPPYHMRSTAFADRWKPDSRSKDQPVRRPFWSIPCPLIEN